MMKKQIKRFSDCALTIKEEKELCNDYLKNWSYNKIKILQTKYGITQSTIMKIVKIYKIPTMIKCFICKKEFKSIRGLSTHLFYCDTKKYPDYNEKRLKKFIPSRTGVKAKHYRIKNMVAFKKVCSMGGKASPTKFKKGHKVPQKCIDILRENSKKQRGKNHPNWKGGISKERDKIRFSEEGKFWRSEIFKRDNYTCVLCNSRGDMLNAHHIKRWADNSLLRLDLNNGITLCRKCHLLTHFKEKQYEKLFIRILENKNGKRT